MSILNTSRSTAKGSPTPAPPKDLAGRDRVKIERLRPCVDEGRFPAKRCVGDRVQIAADVFADGHDHVAAAVRWRRLGERQWREVLMEDRPNDVRVAWITLEEPGGYEYHVAGWIDRFGTWRSGTRKKVEAGQDVSSELLEAAEMLAEAARHAPKHDAATLLALREQVAAGEVEHDRRAELALSETVSELVQRSLPRLHEVRSEQTPTIWADRRRAGFSAWYELFPRSTAPEPGRHGTFRDVESRLGYVAEMGFDVLYLPPIHPIGRTHRKGRNNAVTAEEGDVGSPWAIGGFLADGSRGGHKSIHPDLGTMEDFRSLVRAAGERGLEIALDIAFQCSPDHPYVHEHPEWFKRRPDGTIQYAENPPKKYQDIYPFDFETDAWRELWSELYSIFAFWIDEGVRIFRVDNPHTKSLTFWEWCCAELRARHPDVILLSEAFTRPKLRYRLAKGGFHQGYTYFAWRDTPAELEQYCREIMRTGVADFFRPNFWPNTPDILTAYLQRGGRPASVIRLVLAATLCSSYGIYGPPFELAEVVPAKPGGEEYLDSEKYQIRRWDLDQPQSLRGLIALLNRARREHPALQHNRTIRFHRADNPNVLCYSKTSQDGDDVILCAVNCDPFHQQWSNLHLDLSAIGVEEDEPFDVHDLLTGAVYHWRGRHAVVGLDPAGTPAHVFRVRHRTPRQVILDEFHE